MPDIAPDRTAVCSNGSCVAEGCTIVLLIFIDFLLVEGRQRDKIDFLLFDNSMFICDGHYRSNY